MTNSKLILLLKTFDSVEWRAFEDFVKSPYFNKNKDLIRLFCYLQKQAQKDFAEADVQRMPVFAATFPKQTYDEKQLNYAMSQLLKLAERFIGLRRYEQSEGVLPQYHQLLEYIERDVDKNYQYIFQQANNVLEAQPRRDADYFFQRHLLAAVGDEHFARQNIRKYDPNLQAAADYLDTFYLARKLRYLCDMLDQQKFIQSDYQLNLLSEVKTILAKHPYQNEPVIDLYYTFLLALTEPKAAPHFQTFTKKIQLYRVCFSPEEQRALYHFAINFCIHQIRLGAKAYAQELMKLYQEGVANQVLLENNQISPWTFKNMVKLGLGLQQYDWVENFVKNYSEKLEAGKRTDAYHFNLADLNYHRKNYDEALTHLNQVEFSDIHYQLGAKVMLLKIYYETDATEAFLSLISSFKIFLLRNKRVPKSVKLPYQNFVHLVQEVSKKRTEERESLEQKIQETKMLTDRSWLLEKVSEINK